MFNVCSGQHLKGIFHLRKYNNIIYGAYDILRFDVLAHTLEEY